MSCKLPEALPGSLALVAALLLATVSLAQDSDDAVRSQRPLARCIVAQQFDLPEAPTYCADSGVHTRAGQLGEMLRGLEEGCCDEDFAVALDTLAAELDTGGRRPAMSLNPYRLDSVLAQMQLDDHAQPRTWWQRFIEWLSEWLGSDEDQNDSAFLDWLESLEIPEWAGTAMQWTIYILLVGSALIIVLNEMRVAGVFRRRHGAARAAAPAPAKGLRLSRGNPWQGSEIDKLTPLEQAVALFNWALGTLRDTGALPPDDSLTNLELSRRLRPDDRLKQSFDQLQAAADRALYAEIAPSSEQLSGLRQAWRAIVSVTDANSEPVTS